MEGKCYFFRIVKVTLLFLPSFPLYPVAYLAPILWKQREMVHSWLVPLASCSSRGRVSGETGGIVKVKGAQALRSGLPARYGGRLF
jgi:hypothetical protein